MMRGTDATGGSLCRHVNPEKRIPLRHPLRKVRQVVKEAFVSLTAGFEAHSGLLISSVR